MSRVFALCLLVSAFASAGAIDPPRFYTAEQDSHGIIWAFTRGENSTAFTLEGSECKGTRVPFAEGDRAAAEKAIQIPDGAVCCLWNLSDARTAVTWHCGKESRVLGQYPGNTPGRLRLFSDSQNRLWITGNAPEVHRIDTKTGGVFTHRFTSDEILNSRKEWNTVEAAEDGRGRVWVWSNIINGGKGSSSLRGVLLFDGDQVERKDITGAEGAEFIFLGCKDKTHMWLGVIDDGLYEVDIETLHASRVPAPEGGSFRHIDKVFSVGTDWFVVDYRQAKTSLWRFRDSKWERLIERLDEYPTSKRSWAAAKNGLLISGNPYSWFIGENQPPAQIEWRNGFPIEDGYNFLVGKDGTLFAISGIDGSFFHRKIHLPPGPPEASRITPLDVRDGWTLDAQEHLWALPRQKQMRMLMEWDGKTWQQYEFPPGVELLQIENLAADQEGRIWLLPTSSESIAGFFDSHEKKWTTFSKIETAFEAVKSNPPHFINLRRWNYAPIYSANGERIAYRSGRWEIAYFNGSHWQYWKRTEIAPGGNSSLGVPFFDASDTLCVNYDKITRQFDGHEWKPTTFEDRYPTDEFSGTYKQPSDVEPPPGCVTRNPDSIVRDNQNAVWLTWNGDLYKCRDGVCISVFAKDEPTPFTLRRNLHSVTVNHEGRALVETFIKTFSGNTCAFLIDSKTPPPQVALKITPKSADSVRMQLKTPAPGKVSFRWQLDKEPWQVTNANSVLLDSLSNGEHCLRAQAVDAELQITPVPVEEKFVIKIDAALQMKAFIARLSDPDFAQRKAAILSLARQPDAALAALKAARPTANDDQRWWIDAAIQQIERNQRSLPKNP